MNRRGFIGSLLSAAAAMGVAKKVEAAVEPTSAVETLLTLPAPDVEAIPQAFRRLGKPGTTFTIVNDGPGPITVALGQMAMFEPPRPMAGGELHRARLEYERRYYPARSPFALENMTRRVVKELERLIPDTRVVAHARVSDTMKDRFAYQAYADVSPEHIAMMLAERCAKVGVRFFGVLPIIGGAGCEESATVVTSQCVSVRGTKVFDMNVKEQFVYRFEILVG